MEIKRIIYSNTDFALYKLVEDYHFEGEGSHYRWEYIEGTFNSELIKGYPEIRVHYKLCTYMLFVEKDLQ